MRAGIRGTMDIQKILLGFVIFSVSLSLFASEQKPFAEKHVILQVSDADPEKYTAVLDIANNLIKHYKGPDFIDIEIVAFGKGVQMYFSQTETKATSKGKSKSKSKAQLEENPNKTRVSSLIDNGVRFYVCLNTIDSIQRKTGLRPELIKGVIGVQTGVAFMLEEITNGYTHIHP